MNHLIHRAIDSKPNKLMRYTWTMPIETEDFNNDSCFYSQGECCMDDSEKFNCITMYKQEYGITSEIIVNLQIIGMKKDISKILMRGDLRKALEIARNTPLRHTLSLFMKKVYERSVSESIKGLATLDPESYADFMDKCSGIPF